MAQRTPRWRTAITCAIAATTAIASDGCRRAPPFAPDVAFRDARAKFQQGDLPGAFADADRGIQQLDPLDPSGAWRFRVLKAEVLIWQGKSRDALDLLATQPPATIAADVATRRVLLQGQASRSLQGYDDAERYLTEAARMADARAPEVAGDVALSQGTLCWARRDLDHAEVAFQRALRIARDRKQPFLEANARGSLGLVRMQRHQYGDAADWFQSALAVATSIQARGSVEKSFGNLGWAYQSMGELDRALELFTEAETQAQRYGLLRDQQIWLANLGGIQVSRLDFATAETTFRKALGVARQLENKQQMALSLAALATIMMERGRLDEAERANTEALTLKRAIGERPSELYSLLTQADIAAQRNDRPQAEQLYGDVIRDAKANLRLRAEAQAKLAKLHAAEANPPATPANNQPAGRSPGPEARSPKPEARSFFPSPKPEARSLFRDAIVTIEQARDVLGREEYKLPFSTNAKPIYDAYVGFLMDRGDLAIACAVADMSRAQTLTQGLGVRPPFSTADFQSADRGCRPVSEKSSSSPSNGVVLAYWVAPKRSYLWVLTPTGVKGLTLPGEETLADLVTRYRKALAGPLDARQSANAAGIELYKQLIEPARPWIDASHGSHRSNDSGDKAEDSPRVTIIPDGTLCSLNFETLLVPTPSPHYLIEDLSIANASAIAMLGASRAASGQPARAASRPQSRATRPPARPPKRLLLIGNPQSPDSLYPPLEHATAEMTAIGAHFARDEETVLSGADATPSAYAQAKPGEYDLIHFVAHGTASRPSPLDSAIVLSPDGTSHNLYARDIALTPLGARLVTISACDSAGTRTYSGEGLVGLSWAFLRAGAQEVIAALWEVSDASTAQLMDRLYAGIAAGASPADALRAAKLTMVKSETIYRRPFYWAPFVIYSGGRATSATSTRAPAVTGSRAPKAD